LNTAEELGDVFDARASANGQFTIDSEALRNANPEATKVVADVAAALDLIHGSKSLEELDANWDRIADEATAAGVTLPLELDGAYQDRKAALEQAAN
jgi:hypothetical protein